MTNAEKFILKEKEGKETVIALLSLFDGRSYKFANSALNAVKMFLNEESQFKAENALQKIHSLAEEGKKIFNAVKNAVKDQEIFTLLLKDAKIKSYVEGVLTLKFDSDYKTNHFEKYYKVRFENKASELFGKEIKVELEGAK